jgi:hypothetical protein
MEDLQKDFVPYNFALRMKQLGFDEVCLAIYDNYTDENDKDDSDRFFYIRTEGWNKDVLDKVTPAPLFSQAFRWFREEYNLKGYVEPVEFLDGTPDTYHWSIFNNCNSGNDQLTHEEAEIACLEKLLEIVEKTGS